MAYLFGTRDGRISNRDLALRRKAAQNHGATFNVVHGNDGCCTCGSGCRINTCPNLHTWFEADCGTTAAKVMAQLEAMCSHNWAGGYCDLCGAVKQI